MDNNKNQSGFTLIELVMVIVIIGILAAVALPKFVTLGSDARVGVMKSVQGSMQSANALIYAKAALVGQLGSTGAVTYNGTSIKVVYGYAADAVGLSAAMDLIPATDFTVVAASISHANAVMPSSCSIAYGPAAVATPATSPTSPTYTPTISDC